MCHHRKHLMGYFKFLNGSRIICLPLNIPENMYWQHVFKKVEGEDLPFIFVNMGQYPHNLKINIYHSNKRKPTPYSHSDINLWPRSGPFCWQDPCSGCNSETDLVDALEYFSFNFVPTPNKSLRFTRFRKKDVNCFAIVLTSHWESYKA